MMPQNVPIYDDWPEEMTIKVYRGDIFGTRWEMDLEDYSPQGGPANLNEEGVELEGHVRYTADDLGDPAAVFEIEILNPALRTVRPILPASETAKLIRNGFYDLQIRQGDWYETFLQGRVILGKDKTRS